MSQCHVRHPLPALRLSHIRTHVQGDRKRACVRGPACLCIAGGWMDGWMDGRLLTVQYFCVVYPPSCINSNTLCSTPLRSATVVLPCQDSLTHPYRLRLTSRHVYDLVGVRLRDIGRRRTMTDDVSRWILTRSMPMKTIHQDIHHEPHEPSMLSAAIPVLTPRNQLCHCICCRHHPLSDSQVLT